MYVTFKNPRTGELRNVGLWICLGVKGNEMTAKNYLELGWKRLNPESETVNKSSLRGYFGGYFIQRLKLVLSVVCGFSLIGPAYAQSPSPIDCAQARLKVTGVQSCSSTRPATNAQGYGAFSYFWAYGRSQGFYFNLAGLFPVGPTGAIRSASSDDVGRLLRNFATDTKQAEQWGVVERASFGRVVHFKPSTAGQSCAGIFVDGPLKDLGVGWQYLGYVCTAGSGRLTEGQLATAVSMISAN